MNQKLTDSEIESRLAALPEWSVSEGLLTRTYTFEQYAHGILFAAAVGLIADRMDHHPDIVIGYRRVVISTSTHSAGGLTALDFELAGRIDQSQG